jgi:hypothetical protein
LSTLAIWLDNGIAIVPMSDDEGNNAGALEIEDRFGKYLGMPVLPAN